jgi:hypothetical protein
MLRSISKATASLNNQVNGPGRERVDLFAYKSRPALGPTQLPTQWVSMAKWPKREAGHSPRSSALLPRLHGVVGYLGTQGTLTLNYLLVLAVCSLL